MLSQWNRRTGPNLTVSADPSQIEVGFYSAFENGLHLVLDKLPAPWFIYSFMGVGVMVCLITFIGHVAAEAVNGCCLCFYTLLTSILISLEAALVGYLILDKNWEKDLPLDPTGELARLRIFIEDNFDICRWIGISLVSIQALTLLLALILRAMISSTREEWDSDDDYCVIRRPLIISGGQNPPLTSMDAKGIRSDIWSTRMREKYALNQAELGFNGVDPIGPMPTNAGTESQGRCCIL
ncbi:Tetraspanin-18 [Acorus calamus]|uniref:Tetraspanin-18 n=1 Tax=Acorus calamus TaxID=4465 RepID=A0AAV9E5V9_ACOCL|nr:Tetraspanin-18 [Acorus calamus]